MKLDRNINADGSGKYALIKLREVDHVDPKLDLDVAGALETLQESGIYDWGNTVDSEFFVIRLKDKYAAAALHAYAQEAVRDGEVEYAQEIMEMAQRSGEWHPNCKKPD